MRSKQSIASINYQFNNKYAITVIDVEYVIYNGKTMVWAEWELLSQNINQEQIVDVIILFDLKCNILLIDD